jgi:hypothetical protein
VSKYISTVQTDFFYAVEGTKEYIYDFVDGIRHFTFPNDNTVNKNI